MWLFKEKGRAAYLEFLRNLTSQILLFAFIVIIGSRIDKNPVQSTYWFVNMSMLVCFGFMWFLAFAANGTLLYDKALASRPDVEVHKDSLKAQGVNGGKLAMQSFLFTCRTHPLLVFEVFIIIFVIYASTILGMMSGVITAAGFLKNIS
ncbi:hypothetical protein [Pseudomonas batumici]|uniref:hypothetical protein n=1 Tax=Pseudomonas batumici TaxID=226910 RepID=UPI000589CE3D|nr:hypothetical protein [Pseudomonas batumici]